MGLGLGLGIGAPGSIKRPQQSQARWTVGLQTGVSLLESLELFDVVEVVSSNNDGSSHLGLDNPFALFWFLNRDFYKVQMKNPREWILEFILFTPTSYRNRRLQANPELVDLGDVVCGIMICSSYSWSWALKPHIGFNAEILFIIYKINWNYKWRWIQ